MIKEIQYTGYEASTPDNLASDGSLSAAVGLVNQDGGMRAVSNANEVINLPDGYVAVFIHKTSNGDENYIVLDGEKHLYWLSVEEDLENIAEDYWETHRIGEISFDSFTDIDAVGNTIIALSETTHYILWKDRSYHYLGTKIPNVDISFGVRGWMRSFKHTDGGVHSLKVGEDVHKFVREKISELSYPYLTKYMAEYGENDGYFVNPFFVRYAMELYDGTIVNRSCPVFICPMNTPIVCYKVMSLNPTPTEVPVSFVYYIYFASCLLDYKILNSSKEELSRWGDIIKNINIYVSKPVYFYSLNEASKATLKTPDVVFRGRFMANHTNGYAIKTNEIGQIGSCNYCTDENQMIYAGYHRYVITTLNAIDEFCDDMISLNPYDDQQIESIMKGLHPCYKYYSIPIDKLVAPDYGFDTGSWEWWNGHDEGTIYGVLQEPCGAFSRRVQIPPQKILATLEQQPTIDTAQAADYYDREQLLAKNITAYNNSVSLLDLKRRYNEPVSPSCMFQYRNALSISLDTDGVSYHAWEYTPRGSQVNQVCIHIEENGKNYLLSKEDSYSYRHYNTDGSAYDNFLCLPYPNAKAVFFGDGTNFWECNLSDSAFSNSKMFWLGSVSNKPLNWTIEQVNELKKTCEQENIVSLPGRIYTSETNNPFVFRPSRAISFDGADVIGMASATKALSQGQFGQFPMYAFTSDGIWALEVSASTGGYSAKQPVTRDVCINPLSITQGDNCIYFVSDRGLMLLAGSETACISDVLDDHFAQSLKDTLPGYGKFLGIAGVGENAAAAIAFREFIKEAQIIYDYINQRLIVFKPTTAGSTNIAYAYSLASRSWTFIENDIYQKLNSYPEAIGVSAGGGVVNISTITDGTEGTGLIVTRPLSLDMPEVHKTVDAIIQRGKFRKGCIKQALWGSRDLIHWHLVASSDSHILRNVHGTPYKWFRIGVIATLKDDEALTGCSINYTPKLTNKIR